MKFIKSNNYSKIQVGDERYNSLADFTEVKADAGAKGEIGITDTNGSKRVRLAKNLFSALEEPAMVKVLMSDSQIAFQSVSEDTPGAYAVCKGATIYSSTLAERIMAIAKNIEFHAEATTRCGHIEQTQSDENGNVTVILSFV